MRRDESLLVDFNTEVAKGIYHLRLHRTDPLYASLPAPGQFAMVQVREGASPLLRRPLSYLYAGEDHVEFLYRVVGVGTRILSQAKPGNTLNVLGPLGKGFHLSKAQNNAILVAGGMGMPPMYFLALELKKAPTMGIRIICGAKTDADMALEGRLESEKTLLYRATEDGSMGFKGKASDLVKRLLQEGEKPDVIYSCGPHAMLKTVADLARSEKIPCEVSVEANMACGIGACLGCAVPTAEGYYLQVCEDGPVFDAKMIFGGE